MLAQNFKMPTDLALTDEEFRGLITTLGMMERGELTHVKAPAQAPGVGTALIVEIAAAP